MWAPGETLDRFLNRRKNIQPENRSLKEGSAPAPGAVFRARAENPRAREIFAGSWPFRAQTAERGARSATPGAGVLPTRIFGLQVECFPGSWGEGPRGWCSVLPCGPLPGEHS